MHEVIFNVIALIRAKLLLIRFYEEGNYVVANQGVTQVALERNVHLEIQNIADLNRKGELDRVLYI